MNDDVEKAPSHVIIEPFYGGSHKQLIDGLLKSFYPSGSALLLTLPAKKWKWRLRSSSMHFASLVPPGSSLTSLFCSSMLNLSELLSLRDDLRPLKKTVYFHENQFEYPVREEIERDGQFGWSQMLTALSADFVLWNSNYNLQSFLAGFKKFCMTMPKDQRPDIDSITKRITAKSHVLHFPVDPVSLSITPLTDTSISRPLHIVWNHRWEWDKGPDILFRVLYRLCGLDSSGALPAPTAPSTSTSDSQDQSPLPQFYVSIIGESFGEVSDEFSRAKDVLAPYIKHWGYLESKLAYFHVLHDADIVVSTALHEFFGVAVIEAILCGCYPLCPNRLVFPEYLPDAHLYKTEDQLAKKLRYFIKYPAKLRQMDWKTPLRMNRFSWSSFEDKLRNVDIM